MNDYGMIDIGYVGPAYMWTGKSKIAMDLTKTRIDRAWVNGLLV